MVHNDKFRQAFEDMAVPDEVGAVVQDAISRGKGRKRLKAVRSGLSGFLAVILACAVGVNTLPAFAEQLDKIPGLSAVVEMFKLFDKGLVGAVDEGLATAVSKSAVDKDIELAVHSVVSDGKNLTIYYSLKGLSAETEGKNLRLSDFAIKDARGEILTGGIPGKTADEIPLTADPKLIFTKTVSMIEKEGDKVSSGEMLSFKWTGQPERLPEHLSLECRSLADVKLVDGRAEYAEIPGEWTIPVSITPNHEAEPVVFSGIEVETEAGPATIESLEIYPISAEVRVVLEKQLDAELIFSLVDDKENTYRFLGGSSTEGRIFVQELESCYYSDYDALYLVAEKVDPDAKPEITVHENADGSKVGIARPSKGEVFFKVRLK